MVGKGWCTARKGAVCSYKSGEVWRTRVTVGALGHEAQR
jgi:hypothetical protein